MKIKLWTIQDEQGWNELQSKGVLIPKKEFIDFDLLNSRDAYDWLKVQMESRLGKPTNRDQYPVWAWYQYFDSNKKRPDLRRSGHLPSGKTGYRIEFEKDDKEVLLSDFVLWHYVLNQCYLPLNMDDYENFEENNNNALDHLNFKNYPKHIKDKIEKSWNYIFDMSFNSEEVSFPFEEKKIQATFWKLELKDVIKVDTFIAR